MIILTQQQRDELDVLNKTSPLPGRRLQVVPTKDNRWVMNEEVLSDPYWSHWRPLLEKCDREIIAKNALVDNRLVDGKFDANHPFYVAMKGEKDRIKVKP